ncbi:MATE family efflux transporter [Nonomuraea sp. ATR24]|uniref:MATE family efflux transporter n=1 Tax=Nonomuraea sp. ATR24 TaxID=1676744 RepID=UPI0035BF5CEE
MFRLATPIYVELLTAVVAVGLIDLLWVSGLGEDAIATVTIATTAETLAYGIFLAVPTGVTVLVGRRDGHAPLAPVVRTGWMLWAGLSVPITAAGLWLSGGEAYFLIAFAGWPVYFAQTVVDGVLKGRGDTRRPMRHALLCNALVVALDPLFIHGLGLGVEGAALATVLARAITLAASFPALRSPEASTEASTEPGAGPRTGPVAGARAGLLVGAVVRTGLPMSGDFLARALVGMVLVDLVAGFGTAELAGYGVGQKVMLAGVMAFYALRQAMMIRTARGEHTGSPLLAGLATGAVVAAVLNVAAEPVAALFAADPGPAVGFLRWMTLYLVPFGGLIAVGGVLQATGRGGRLLAATLAGFAVQLPLAYALSAWLGVSGVWLSMAAGATLSLTAAVLPRTTRAGGPR